jgi:hypothetical protein
MSFPHSNSKNCNIFGRFLTQIANVTTNLPDDIIQAAALLNIDKDTLTKMMLSHDPEQIECINRIKNLVNSLREYEDGNLPEQLTEYISQLNQYISENPLNEATLPSYINILCPGPAPLVSSIILNQDYDQDYEQDYEQDYDQDYDQEPVSLIAVSEENIKHDICVICFINLNDFNNTVVATVCKHQYHNNCICSWINIKRECPLCKNKL